MIVGERCIEVQVEGRNALRACKDLGMNIREIGSLALAQSHLERTQSLLMLMLVMLLMGR